MPVSFLTGNFFIAPQKGYFVGTSFYILVGLNIAVLMTFFVISSNYASVISSEVEKSQTLLGMYR